MYIIYIYIYIYIYKERERQIDRQTDRQRNRNQIRSFIYPPFHLKLDTLALELDCMRFNTSIDDE